MTFEELKKTLAEVFKDKNFSFKENEPLLAKTWNKNSADLVISHKDPNKNNFAVLVATSDNPSHRINWTYAKSVVRKMVEEYDYWVGLVWNKGGLSVWIPDAGSKSSGLWRPIIIDDLLALTDEFVSSDIKEDYLAELLTTVELYKPSSKIEEETKRIILDWIRRLEKKDLLQRTRQISVSLEKQFELLKFLFKSDNVDVVYRFCRYISLQGLSRILLDKKESMCGLAAMNDKSEGFYLDRCLVNSSFNLYRKPQSQIDEFNKVFILSLCKEKKKDDLTMWRLYGCDGNGACLVYEVDRDKIRNSKDFILLPISYGNASNKIILLFKILSKMPYIGGLKFKLSYKYIWQYFVKPDEFKIEEEYRLLYVSPDHNKNGIKWILNSTHSIFHPLIEFASPLFQDTDPDSFPLELKEIILGPKCSEALVNKVQLQTYIPVKSVGTKDVVVSRSKIDFYR